MGFLTRWISSAITDGATRDAALETHLKTMTDKCEKTYVSLCSFFWICDSRARARGDEQNECLIEDEFQFISFRSDDDDDGYGRRVGVKPSVIVFFASSSSSSFSSPSRSKSG